MLDCIDREDQLAFRQHGYHPAETNLASDLRLIEIDLEGFFIQQQALDMLKMYVNDTCPVWVRSMVHLRKIIRSKIDDPSPLSKDVILQ